MNLPSTRYATNGDLICVTLDSQEWEKRDLYQFAFVNRAWLVPSLSRLWKVWASVDDLCRLVDVQLVDGTLLQEIDGTLLQESTRGDFIVKLVGDKRKVQLFRKYSPWITNLSSSDVWTNIQPSVMLDIFVALAGTPVPFPSVSILRPFVPSSSERDHSQLKALIKLSPKSVVDLSATVSDKGMPLLTPLLSGFSQLQTVNFIARGFSDSPMGATEGLPAALQHLHHLRSIRIAPQLLTGDVLWALGQLSTLKTLRTHLEEGTPQNFSNVLGTMAERAQSEAILLFPVLEKLRISLEWQTDGGSLAIFGPNLRDVVLRIPACPHLWHCDPELDESIFRHLSTLSDLRNLKMQFTGRLLFDHFRLADQYKQLDWESVKHLHRLTRLKTFELSHPSSLILQEERLLKLSEHWGNMECLVFDDEQYDEVEIVGSDAGSHSQDDSRCSIAVLPTLLKNIPYLDFLSMKFSNVISKNNELPSNFIRREFRAFHVQHSFGRSSVPYAKDLAVFLTTIFEGGTIVDLGFQYNFWVMMHLFLHGEAPKARDEVGEVMIPKMVQEVRSRQYPNTSEFQDIVRGLRHKPVIWKKCRPISKPSISSY